VVWAECIVEIAPSSPTVAVAGTVFFTAVTIGEGCNEPNYTWEIVASDCTAPSWIDETGLYTASDECNCDCSTDVIKVTDTANGNIFAEATVTITGCCYPEVTISGPDILGSPCPVSATYTAETTLDGAIIPGTYTWELDGVSAGTYDSFEVTCTEAATNTLLVTDTANGNVTDSIMIQCDCPPPVPPMESTFEGCGRPFFYGFGVMTIQGVNTVFGPFTTLSYDSPLTVKLPKLVNRKLQRITQFVILLPSILFPAWDYPAIVEVTVDGLSSPYSLLDTFIIPKCGQ
jgi:hypothetical protein